MSYDADAAAAIQAAVDAIEGDDDTNAMAFALIAVATLLRDEVRAINRVAGLLNDVSNELTGVAHELARLTTRLPAGDDKVTQWPAP